jgi:cell wall-associated NlpC family hydrolase
MRPAPLLLLCCAAALAAGCSDADSESAPAPKAEIADWRWAPKDELPAREPAAQDPPDKLSAAERAARARTEPEPPPEPPPPPPAPPELPDLDDASGDKALIRAEVLKNGVALPPLEAPPQVRAIIEAGNVIARSPYKWGGGHGKWQDNGYDCSGSVSYALAAAGLLDAPLASGPLMRWGKPGKGRWITIYTNPGHMVMVVAGLRFDTSGQGRAGTRWQEGVRSTAGFAVRRIPGL